MPGGNADQLSDKIRAGDQLVACSATVLKAGKEGEYEREGYGRRPYDSFERIMFPTAGQVGNLAEPQDLAMMTAASALCSVAVHESTASLGGCMTALLRVLFML